MTKTGKAALLAIIVGVGAFAFLEKPDAAARALLPDNPLAQQFIAERNAIVRAWKRAKGTAATLAEQLQQQTRAWADRASASELIDWSIIAARIAQLDSSTRVV